METLSRLALTVLINALWQITLVACVGALCAWLLRNAPAKYRHLVWVMALGLCVLLPIESLHRVGMVARADVPNLNSQIGRVTVESLRQTASWSGHFDFLRRRSRSIPLSPYLGLIALGCYFLSISFHSRRLWRAWKKTSEVRSAAYARKLPDLMSSVAARCQKTLGLAAVPIFCSASVPGPITLSARTPIIILPENLFDEISSVDLTSVFAHEMAHIRRNDFLMNIVYELAFLPISFHPAAALVKRRIDETRELACDEIAAERLASACDYARSLVHLARRMTATPSIARSDYTLGVFDANNLEERIMRLLDQKSKISSRVANASFGLVAFLLAASSIFASAFSLNVNEENKTQTDATLKPFVGTWQGPSRTEIPQRIFGPDGASSGEIYAVGKDVTAPVPIYNPSPLYSKEARKAKLQGVVELSFVVNPRGDVSDIRVVKALGKGLDKNAVDTVRTWKFKPALRKGISVTVRVTIEVTFIST